jgi:hypothetical protein
MKMTRSLVASVLLAGWVTWLSVGGQIPADTVRDLADGYAGGGACLDNGRSPLDYLDLERFVNDWLWTGRPGGCDADFNFDGVVDLPDFTIFASRWSDREKSVVIIVDSGTYGGAASEIDRLGADIANDLNVDVFVYQNEWRNAADVKDLLTERYDRSGLIGAILIGEIPTAYSEYRDADVMPTDWYYQDLSDKFVDSDGDGKFEREYYSQETDVTMRDIWSGRIKPPVSGEEGIMLLKQYLDRNHQYRTGNLTYRRRMLYFGSIAINQDGMSKTDYDHLVGQIDDYTGLYESDEDVNSIYDTDLERQKQAYLTELSRDYECVFVNIHGSSTSQWLGGSTSVSSSEVIRAQPKALFTVLASCSNGNFTRDDYLAGWYLFSGDSLVVMANSTVAMNVGATSVEFLKDYIQLGLGVTFGEMYKNDLSWLTAHLFGDPTLTLRPKPTGEVPRLDLDTSHLDFGSVASGTKPRRTIIFNNVGSSELKVSFKKGVFSIDGEAVDIGYWDVFYYEHPDTGSMFRDFEVPAGSSKTVPFVFYPRSDGPVGRYSMTILFQTNAPESPYVRIGLSGDAYTRE